MHGYDVLTSEDEKVGHVVGESGDNLIVEQGAIFKSKRALPRAFAHVDEAAGVVRTTISKQLLGDAPKVEDDGVDELEVARYYGLADDLPNDPDRTPEDDAHSAGVPTAEEEWTETRNRMEHGDPHPSSPGATGGDRFRDYKGKS
ncbi:MAG: hypothetical protein QOE36_2681 [Gaiellaceae bacterium]|jgi:hypothetical protein|nr:hypothetical protein [Gaiellaceae bacterium]